jgi:hypothetical protein
MSMNRQHMLLVLALAAALVALPACNSSDPVASEGSTIRVTANPKDIPEALRGELPSTITAIVLSSGGIRQTGVEVIFTTEDGCFGTEGNNCLLTGEGSAIEIALTDSDGIASVLLYTFTSTTVSAQSGSAMDEETVSIGGEQIVGSITLDPRDDITGGVPRNSEIDFLVTVVDTNGLPIRDALVILDIDPPEAGTHAFPFGSRTDEDGMLEFKVEVLDRFDIRVQILGEFSNSLEVLLSTP